MWQRERVFRASLVEICEVDTDSPFAVFLLYDHDVRESVGIFYFSDLPSFEEIVDLVIDHLVSLWSELSALLFDGFKRRVDVEFVRNDVGVDANHVFVRPGKTVGVFL